MPTIDDFRNKIICGNTLDVLKQIPDNSVDCIITSPPYWGLRFYGEQTKTIWDGDPNCEHEWGELIVERVDETGFERNRQGLNKCAEEHDGNPRYATTDNPPVKKEHQFCKKCGAWYGQLGLEPDLGMYHNHLLQITAELKRILKKTGTMWWVHGDSYCGSQGHFDAKNPKAREGKLIHDWKDYPKKCLYLQNYRLAIRMIDEQDWTLRNSVCWVKPNHLPSPVEDRLTNAYEPVFLFTKSGRYFFDLDAIRVPHTYCGIKDKRPMGILRQRLYPNSGYNQSNDPHLSQYKYTGSNINDENKLEQCQQFKLTDDEYNTLKQIQQYSGSPARRAKLSLVEGKLTTTVRKKLYDVGDYLKTKLKEANLTVQQLAEITGLRETTIAHYFRTDISGQAIPDRNTWEVIKPLLNLGNYDDYIDEEIRSALPQPHPRGKNPGDVWIITTQPAPNEARGKHFAIFPEKLVEPMILAGCPQEVCAKCGKPRERIIIKEHVGSSVKRSKYSHMVGYGNGSTGNVYCIPNQFAKREFIGWSIPCNCDSGYQSGIVLDPFVGSGTTCVVAKKLGRDYIGIDIHPEYCEIARKRLEKTPRTLALDRFTED